MAFYSFGRIKICSRTKTKSAIATAAYHSATKIQSEYDGNTFDFTHKSDVGETFIKMPAGVPHSWIDENVSSKERVSKIWNDVELAHPSSNAQLCRYNYIAFDNTLTYEENLECIDKWIETNCTSKGMGVVYSFHNKPGNPHVDLMYLMTEYDEHGKPKTRQEKQYLCRDKEGSEKYLNASDFKSSEGFEKVYKYKNEAGELKQMTVSEASKESGWERVNKHPVSKTVRRSGWDSPELANQWRKSWEVILNSKLEEKGFSERVDCRSYEEQGSEKLPTIHVGYGPGSEERAKYNVDIKTYNENVKGLENVAMDCMIDLNNQLTELKGAEELTELELDRERERYSFNTNTLKKTADSDLFSQFIVETITSHLKALELIFKNLFENLKNRVKEKKPEPRENVAELCNELIENIKVYNELEEDIKTLDKGIEEYCSDDWEKEKSGEIRLNIIRKKYGEATIQLLDELKQKLNEIKSRIEVLKSKLSTIGEELAELMPDVVTEEKKKSDDVPDSDSWGNR